MADLSASCAIRALLPGILSSRMFRVEMLASLSSEPSDTEGGCHSSL